MHPPPWRLTLRVIAGLVLLVSILWFFNTPGYEPLLAILGALAALLSSFIASDTSPNEVQEQRNRSRMLEKVKAFWIKGVLENSLHGAALIEIGLAYYPDAVVHPWGLVLQSPNRPNQTLPSGTKITQVFDEVGGELLILGAPGSGKTTMLLELARDLIARAEQNVTHPIPAVFNLASWADKRQPIVDWLVAELRTKYLIPRKISQAWVKDEKILPLLDGLDEVKLEHRVTCVEAINHFQQECGMTQIVVCSRSADYETLTTRFQLQSAIILQPLTSPQVSEYLTHAGHKLAGLRAALRKDKILRELTQTPLLLSIMMLTYQGMPSTVVLASTAPKERYKQLFDAYIYRMLTHRGANKHYSPQQIIYWLGWLAQQMSQHNQSIFLLESLQPSWLNNRAQQRVYMLIIGLIFGVMGGLAGGLIFGVMGGLAGGLTGLIVGLDKSYITPVEVLRWSRIYLLGSRLIVFGLICGLTSVLISGPTSGVATGLITGLMLALTTSLSGSEDIETRTNLLLRLRSAKTALRAFDKIDVI